VTVPFPVDLPDLLRLACGQGKMRLYTSFSAERGHQSALARTGDGWDSDADPDCLVSMTKVLRQRFGNMLERERANLVSVTSDSKLQHRMSEDAVDEFQHRDCDCEYESAGVGGESIAEALEFVLSRRGLDNPTVWAITAEVLDAIWGRDEQPNLYEVEMTTAGSPVQWKPHRDYAGEPMNVGEFRDPPHTMREELCDNDFEALL
jgi:hypothetical protein